MNHDFISTHFILPIEMTKGSRKAPESMQTHTLLMSPENVFEEEIQVRHNVFTTDKEFLLETQQVLELLAKEEKTDEFSCSEWFPLTVVKEWEALKFESTFYQKFDFIRSKQFGAALAPKLEELNTNPWFLGLFSLLQFFSPLVLFLVPLIIFLVPLILILFSNKCENYWELFDSFAGKHCVKNISLCCRQFKSVSWGFIAMSCCYGGAFIYQLWQGFVSLKKQWTEHVTINQHFGAIHHLLTVANNKIKVWEKILAGKPSYQAWLHGLLEHESQIQEVLDMIGRVRATEKEVYYLDNLKYMGVKKVAYYKLHKDEAIDHLVRFAAGFLGYDGNMNQIAAKLAAGRIKKARFNKEMGHEEEGFKGNVVPFFKDCLVEQFYPGEENAVQKNNVEIKNMLLTGPNASGKTTLVKSVATNLLLTQQIGCGFYEECLLSQHFHHFHIYENAPLFENLSLFESETRQCMEILKFIKDRPEENHFCFFDELFSGTNPKDAVESSVGFLTSLMNEKNVCFMVTTHFTEICQEEKFEPFNYYMETIEEDEAEEEEKTKAIEYTFQLKKGISFIQGGKYVLARMTHLILGGM